MQKELLESDEPLKVSEMVKAKSFMFSQTCIGNIYSIYYNPDKTIFGYSVKTSFPIKRKLFFYKDEIVKC